MLLQSKYSQFDESILATIREQDVHEVVSVLGGDASGRYRRLQVQLAYLKTDPKIGEKVTASLDTCPFKSTGRGGQAAATISAQQAKIAQLEALLTKKK